MSEDPYAPYLRMSGVEWRAEAKKAQDELAAFKEKTADLLMNVSAVMKEMLPGVRHIAIQRYDRLNDTFVEVDRTLRTLGRTPPP